ncbi:MAG: hypothetical protein PVI78_04675, partial [Anaerolineales bacterium]
MRHQSYAYAKNHWSLEPDLIYILRRYWEDLEKHIDDLHAFGDAAGSELYEIGDHVDQHATPELVMFD